MIPFIQIFHTVFFWVQDFIPTAEFFVYPYLTSQGLIPYQQIIDHHFPGLFFLPVNFFSLGFTSPQSFKLLALLVILITSVFLSRLAKNLTADKVIIAQTVFLYSLWQIFFSGSLLWIDLFLPLFFIPGYLFFIKKRYLLSGIMFSLAVIFKQTAILPILYLAFLSLKHKSAIITLFFPTLVTLLLLGLYFVHLKAGSDFWFWNFTFNFGSYSAMATRLPNFRELIKISLPLLLFFWSVLLAFRAQSQHLLRLAGLIIVLTLPAFARFGLEHFQPAVPFFVLLLPLSLSQSSRLRWFVLVVSIMWVGFFNFKAAPSSQMVNFSTNDIRLYKYASQLTSSGTTIAVLGASPLIYSQSKTLPPGNLFLFSLPWLFSQTELRQLSVWQIHPPDLIIFDPDSRVDGLSIFTSAPRLVEYMQMFYRPDENIAGKTIYKRI